MDIRQIHGEEGPTGVYKTLCELSQRVSSRDDYERYVNALIWALQMSSPDYEQLYGVGSASARHLQEEGGFTGLTMQTERLLKGLQQQIEDIVDRGLKGDIYETGIWRGGTAIFMVCVLQAYERLKGTETSERQFWFFDSFEGFQESMDENLDQWLSMEYFAPPVELVKKSFANFGAHSARVHIVKGWFEDTLLEHQADRSIALLRMDGDLYSSTKIVLERLYPAVEPDGWIIVDDYYWRPDVQDRVTWVPLAREAVDEYRAVYGIGAPIVEDLGRPSWRKLGGEVSLRPDGSPESLSLTRSLLWVIYHYAFRLRAIFLALAISIVGLRADE